MKLLSIEKSFKVFTGVKFALLILALIALASSLGSFIEQEEPLAFYEQNYPLTKPIFGLITWKLIIQLGLDHVYRTWWFFLLLFFLVISLISCTLTRQFPIFTNSKDYFFRKQKKSFLVLPFSVKIKTLYYLKENVLTKIQELGFYIYQKGNLIYGYKGLIGRISPILVHFSLIVVLLGSFTSAFNNFKAQEMLPKGEIFHIQNPIQIGWFTSLPPVTTRVNDFWVEYENNRIHQFYSNLSILDNAGNEIKNQTISVNNPLRYKNTDFYQSDWNLVGIRFQQLNNPIVYEAPVFSLEKSSKSWITWITDSTFNFTLVFDQLQNTFLVYDTKGNFLSLKNIGDPINAHFSIIDILPSTGLQIKYDPSIPVIYFGFGLLMVTACLSYLPYTQIWVFHQSGNSWLGGSTNRGKIQLEIEFENLVRYIEKILSQNIFTVKKKN
jgi:cytochrome c biogenesis protein